MTNIRASCPDCGDVELTVSQVRVVVCAGDSRASYVFECPVCRRSVSKAAQPQVVDVLVASGVAVVFWQPPAELNEPHSGPPISHDELLRFHFELDQGDCMAELTRFKAEMGNRSGD